MVIHSLASATYFSGHFSIAGTNDRTHDVVMSGTASVHRAHTFGIFQGITERILLRVTIILVPALLIPISKTPKKVLHRLSRF
ncbi:MAG: hypothetical protein ACTHMC_24095 [Pseudobacter sp.]|uniref:hypothetical protein n=1 Tax=Pseudobacter sp. TaxID=2045420 RepID=UPI003F80809F